jgi:hypothetical protein
MVPVMLSECVNKSYWQRGDACSSRALSVKAGVRRARQSSVYCKSRFSGAGGQASVLGIAFALILMTGIFTLYNISQVSTEKTNLVNAADAAAYSSGVHVARNLNYIAYTNRAMMANHIAVGHMTSYWSWINYADELVSVIDDICDTLCPLIPYIGNAISTYVSIVETDIDWAIDVAEVAGPVIAVQNDVLNEAYFQSQGFLTGARYAISTVPGDDPISELQQAVLESYHEDNSLHGLTRGLPSHLSSNVKLQGARARAAADRVALTRYLSAYGPDDDDGRIKGLVEENVDHLARQRSDRWIRNGQSRNWRWTFWPIRMLKDGQTQHREDDGSLNWYAEDRFRFQTWDFSKFRYRTRISTDRHTADTQDDFYDGYNGIRRYTSVAEDRDREECAGPSVTAPGMVSGSDCFGLTVIAKRDLGSARLQSLGDGDHSQSGADLYTIARSEVFFHRPHTMPAFGTSIEFANVFNPFWKARLSD